MNAPKWYKKQMWKLATPCSNESSSFIDIDINLNKGSFRSLSCMLLASNSLMNIAMALFMGSEYILSSLSILRQSFIVEMSRPGSVRDSNSMSDKGMNIAFLNRALRDEPCGSKNDMRP